MEEKSRCTGTREGRCDLLAHESRFPHACHHDLAATRKQDIHSLNEAIVNPVDQVKNRLGFNFEYFFGSLNRHHRPAVKPIQLSSVASEVRGDRPNVASFVHRTGHPEGFRGPL